MKLLDRRVAVLDRGGSGEVTRLRRRSTEAVRIVGPTGVGREFARRGLVFTTACACRGYALKVALFPKSRRPQKLPEIARLIRSLWAITLAVSEKRATGLRRKRGKRRKE